MLPLKLQKQDIQVLHSNTCPKSVNRHLTHAWDKVFLWSYSKSQWPSYGMWHFAIPWCTTTQSLVIL